MALDDLDTHSQVYADCYVALRIFGMRYPDYIQQTSPKERAFYQFFLALEGLKEERAHERIKTENLARENADRAMVAASRP